MSVAIKIQNAVKKYGDLVVIPNLSLDIKQGEFFTLLGPSGCGKTTLLRMIAGFNSIEGGQFYFNDLCINDIDPSKRNLGMVFQNYAIFPHLTVKQNVAFGLKNRKVSKEEMEERTLRFLQLMQIDSYADRLPDKLSGGQQQRVALARALVIEPDVLLMDEPLSNLDAKLRIEMRAVIKEVQNKVGITTVYVTHDQEEAMAVSDRIAAFDHGVVQQIGTPQQLYQRPGNLFVATFIGHTNVLAGSLAAGPTGTAWLTVAGTSFAVSNLKPDAPMGPVQVSVRPEEFYICPKADAETLAATIESSIFLGLNTHYIARLTSGDRVEIIQESTINTIIAPGSEIFLAIKKDKINLLSQDGTCNLLV